MKMELLSKWEIADFSAESIMAELEKMKKPFKELSNKEKKELESNIAELIVDNLNEQTDLKIEIKQLT